MKNLIRFELALVICIGGYLISLSYSEYAKWQKYLILGDLSGAEAYEIGFWITVIPGFSAIFISAFLLGMLFASRNQER